MARQARPLGERLNANLEPCPDPGCECLLWQLSTNQSGYGQIATGSRTDGTATTRPVHLVAWELEHGPVEKGLELDHVKDRGCRHRHCANLAHLEPVTHHVNVLRGATATTSTLKAVAAISPCIVVPDLTGRVRFASSSKEEAPAEGLVYTVSGRGTFVSPKE